MRHGNNPARDILGAVLCGVGAWYTQELWYQASDFRLIPLLLAAFAAATALSASVKILFFVIPQIWRYLNAWRVKKRVGSSGWEIKRVMRKAKMHKKRGFLAGIAHNMAVFCDIESAMLVLAPAGEGKTRDVVIPNLLYNTTNMIVTDLKGTLACITAKARAKVFKHVIHCLNPGGIYSDILGIGACYNPLQILIDDWADPKRHKHLFSDARSLIRQIAPSPKMLTDNEYFRQGSAKFLLFACIRLVTQKDNPTLTDILLLLSDMNALEAELYEAACDDILKGDLARLATDIITKLEDGDAKQRESFREGAVQHLEDYSPSGTLAQCTSKTDFRFHDMRKRNMTVYIIADPTVQDVFEKWIGLIAWCAMTELMRSPTGQKVAFMADEVTNFKVNGLPKLLTKAREFGVMIILIIQELKEWGNTYGHDTTETVLSQTEAKLIIGANNQTAEMVSRMLGETPQMNLNYNLGASFFDDISHSLSEGGRKLMTADEARRSKHAILFYRKLKPAKIETVGYHKISPLKHRAGINPLFGKKYKGRTRLKL